MPDIRALVRLLREGDPEARVGAARELGNLGPGAALAAEALAASLAETALRSDAAWALAKIGAAAVPALTGILAHPDPQARQAAVGVLWKVAGEAGTPALEALHQALRDCHPEVRAYTARAIGEIGRRAARLAAALVDALADPAPEVRAAAAESLGRAGEADDRVAQGLTHALADRDAEVRQAAARSLRALAATGSAPLRRALAALDHLSRTANRSERAVYREAAAAIRAHTLENRAPAPDNLPRPAEPRSDFSNLPIVPDPDDPV